MKLVYLSGPYSDPRGPAYVDDKINAAISIAKELWRMGAAVICPHANTRHFDGIVPKEQFIEGDLLMVERCDAIVMMPGWWNSEGAKAELQHAFDRSIPIVLWPHKEVISQWLQQPN